MLKNCFLYILFMLAQTSQNDPKQMNADKVNVKLSGFSLNDISVPDAFAKILDHLNLPGGIVRSLGCERTMKYSFNVDDLSLAEALNYITSYDKGYIWVKQDGVINLIPSGPVPELLSVRVDKLVIAEPNRLAVAVAGELLVDPAVQARAKKLKINRATHPFEYLSNPTEPHIQIELHDISVREGLNQIALKHGSAVWQYSEAHCQEENEYWLDWIVH